MQSRLFYLLLLLSFGSQAIQAQNLTIKGKIIDSLDLKALPGAAVSLINIEDAKDKLVQITQSDGSFIFQNLGSAYYQLRVDYMGYQSKIITVSPRKNGGELGSIILSPEGKLLDEYVVREQFQSVEQREDTLSFNSKAYKTNPDANAEDLVKKMPGMEMSGGTIKAQGEEVQRILVDGKPFFGDDPNIALKNLPAEMIDRVEVFDQESDQSRFTGFSDGNASRTLNFITKPGMRKGQFGKIYGGYGTDNRYNAGLTYNSFKNNRRLTVLGLSNNINQQNFSSQDLIGMMGGSGGRGGGPGSGMGGLRNFVVGSQDGITASNAIGINYSNQWGKISEFTASYFANYADNRNDQSTYRTIFLAEDSLQFYNADNVFRSTNHNHRLSLRMKWDPDSSNSIVYTPNITWQGSGQRNQLSSSNFLLNGFNLNQSENLTENDNTAISISNNILLQHKFRKEGRTVSLNGSLEQNFRNGQRLLDARNLFLDSTGLPFNINLDQLASTSFGGRNSEINLTYTEPLGKKGQLQLNAIYNDQLTLNDQKTRSANLPGAYELLDTLLSNVFENVYRTYRAGAAYRYNTDKLNASLGINAQYAELQNEQEFPFNDTLTRSFRNLLPYGFVRYRISRTKQFRMFFRSRTNAPSVSQLQQVLNNSNPVQLYIGNPALDQEINNFLVMRYSASNPKKSTSFSGFIRLRNITNYVANSNIIAGEEDLLVGDVLLRRGSSLTSPVNMRGFWSNSGNVSFGFPVKKLKSNLNLGSTINLQRIPGIVNGAENLSRSTAFSQSITLGSNISERVDFTINYTGNYNWVFNTLQPRLNSNFYSHLAGISGNFWLWKKIVMRTEVNHSVISGLTEGYNPNFLLWNMSLARKVMKGDRAEFRITAFDILGQNQSVQRLLTETHIEDLQNSILSRYFMVSFTYNLRAFDNATDMDEDTKLRLERMGIKP